MELIKIVTAIGLFVALPGCGNEPTIYGKAWDDYQAAIKPYSYYWIKNGVTQEQKRADSKACGAGPSATELDNVDFPNTDLQKYKRAGDPNDIAAVWRFRHIWDACMTAKGYRRMAKPSP